MVTWGGGEQQCTVSGVRLRLPPGMVVSIRSGMLSCELLPLILPGSAEMIQKRGIHTFLFPVCAHSAQRSHHSRRHQHIDMREQWPAFVGDERTSTRPERVWRGGITAERAGNGESVPVAVAREGEDGDMHM